MIGMIDWLTLIIDMSLLPECAREFCRSNVDRIQRISPDGEIRWETSCRESIRSDSHQVTVSFGSTLQICGSPARVVDCNNVFGSLDIQQCAASMIRYASLHCGIILPLKLSVWRCSKIDVTQNFDMGSLQAVQQAIDYFKPLKIGRQKTSTEDTTVMWGKGSSLHMGKIYAKGPHARKMQAKKSAFFSPDQLAKADRLLRIEYSIRRLMIKRIYENSRREWFDYDPQFLLSLHADYFGKFISSVEVVDMDNIRALLLDNVGKEAGKIPTAGQAQAAYNCYTNCKLLGYQQAKASFSQPSWSRHLKNLSTIGLVAADLQQQNVVPLRKRSVELHQPISSWDQINLALRA